MARRITYLVAILLPLAGAVIRLYLLHSLENRAAFITFYPVVVIAALVGGLGPGVLATFLSVFLAAFFWIEPFNHYHIGHPADRITLGIYVLFSLMIAFIVESMKQAQARERQARADAQRAEEQIRAAEALRRSEERFRLIFDQASIGKVIVDCDLRTVQVNDAICRILGYSRDELLALRFSDFTYPDDLQADLAQAQALLEGAGEGFEMEKRYVRKDGRIIWVNISVDAIRGPDGKPLFLFGLVQDIHERKLAAEALARTNARLRLLLDALPVGVTIAEDAECRIITTNPAASSFFETSGQNISASSPTPPTARYFHQGRELKPEEMPMQVAVFGNRDVPAMEVEGRMTSGRRWTGLVSATPLHDQGGNVIGGLAVMQDITKRKRDEESLKRYAEDLDRSNKELQQFVYIVSHDLQEPLRMVTAFGDLIKERNKDKLDDSSREYIELALAASRRAMRLIRDLLDYTKVGSKPLETQPVALDQVLDKALQDLVSEIQGTGARVERSPLPVVQADPGLVRQVFQNLIGNAIQYRKPEQTPVITIAAEGNGISIADNGIGIDPVYHEKIFEPFQRLHTNDQYEGSGLGLAICKRIVERCGGTISVESRPGQGSTFRFTLGNHSRPSGQPAGSG